MMQCLPSRVSLTGTGGVPASWASPCAAACTFNTGARDLRAMYSILSRRVP